MGIYYYFTYVGRQLNNVMIVSKGSTHPEVTAIIVPSWCCAFQPMTNTK